MSLDTQAQQDLETMLERRKDLQARIALLKVWLDSYKKDTLKVEKITKELFSLYAEENKVRQWLQEYGLDTENGDRDEPKN